ncbi:MAG: tripartite tricarboxylate transporter substrate binding protein [Burkholderiaceae bacterium]|nr:tripartite tricarboxylate transporter substrate binding protein [Burkholderiaceae bacterium]
MNSRTTRRALLGAAAAGMVAPMLRPAPARAASGYPAKSIQMIIPIGAGGVADAGGRIVAKRLGEELGQTVVVENRPGANQVVGVGHVSRAAADGYTLLWTTSGFTASPVLVKDYPFVAARDFLPIALGATSNNVLVGSTNFEGKTLADFVEHSKRHPGTMFYGTPSGATTLVFEYLKLVTGAKLEGVMYKSTPNAWTDLVGGRIHALMDGPRLSKGQIDAGRARGLAVCGSRRAPELPDVPTAAEQGYPDFVLETWQGLFAPVGTPPEIAQRLEAAMRKVMGSPATQEELRAAGLDGSVTSSAEFTDLVRKHTDLWASVARQAGIKPQ